MFKQNTTKIFSKLIVLNILLSQFFVRLWFYYKIFSGFQREKITRRTSYAGETSQTDQDTIGSKLTLCISY